MNLTCSVPSNESVSRIELGRGYTPGDGQLPLAVATSNNGTHITNGGYNYSLTLEWVNDSNTSVSLIIPNVTLAHAGYYTCNVTLRNCSVASGVHCNYSAGEEDDQYHANRTLTQRMHLTVIPATTIAPTTLVSHTTSTSHRPHRRPVSKRPTHKPVTLGPFPIDPWRPKTTWVHWALLLITCAVVAPVLLIIINYHLLSGVAGGLGEAAQGLDTPVNGQLLTRNKVYFQATAHCVAESTIPEAGAAGNSGPREDTNPQQPTTEGHPRGKKLVQASASGVAQSKEPTTPKAKSVSAHLKSIFCEELLNKRVA